ncbi:glucose dehydrogenase [Acetobacter orleanensis]|nr:glucose dehydrogenase [Acetobacter orleanensis]
MVSFSKTSGAGRILVPLLGLLIALLGLVLFLGGAYLLFLGGSPYYVLMGTALLLSGYLLGSGDIRGAWLYLASWAATILWTIYEVGFDWWAWLPRDFGPTIIAALVVACLPLLRRQENQDLRSGSFDHA